MNVKTIEIDIGYNDYFIEVYTIKCQELDNLIHELATDNNKKFNIGEKTFFKKDLNSVSIVDHGLFFTYMDILE